jgi:thiamine monophosphate kinase
MAKKKTKKTRHKPGKVFWVTPSPGDSRICVRLHDKHKDGECIVVCRKHVAAVVAPAKLPRKGQCLAFRFTAVPEE